MNTILFRFRTFGSKCKEMLNNDFCYYSHSLRSIPKKFILLRASDGKCFKYNFIVGDWWIDKVYVCIMHTIVMSEIKLLSRLSDSCLVHILQLHFVLFSVRHLRLLLFSQSFSNRFRFMNLRDNRNKFIILWHMSR